MLFKQLVGVLAAAASAQALSKGFNSGNVKTDGSPKVYADFEAEFKKAQNLPGTSGWNSARLYTNIQAGTTNEPIAAFQAAIDTKTTMLLGLWASAGETAIENELAALQNAIDQYGSSFTDLVVGISVGSEDLYRNSVTGQINDSGVGANPSTLVDYIQQTKKALADTKLASAPIGHVDTWDAWANGTNSAVADNCDWVGMDTYPYFEYQKNNSIANAKELFFDAYEKTKAATGKSQDNIYITETGWPVSGKTEGEAVASIENAEIYWQQVSCELQGEYNVWWYTLQDAQPTIPNPSFGIMGTDLNGAPLYNLACNASTSSSSSSSSATGSSTGSSSSTHKHGQATAANSGSASATASGSASGAAQATGGMIGGGMAGGMGGNSTGSAGAAAGTGSMASPTMGGASGSASGAAIQTGNSAATIGSSMGAGLLAFFGLAVAL